MLTDMGYLKTVLNKANNRTMPYKPIFNENEGIMRYFILLVGNYT